MSSIIRCRNAVIRASPSPKESAPGESSSVNARQEKEKPRRHNRRRGRELFYREVTTAERFSSTGEYSAGQCCMHRAGIVLRRQFGTDRAGAILRRRRCITFATPPAI